MIRDRKIFSKCLMAIFFMAFTIESFGQSNCKCLVITPECVSYCLGTTNNPSILKKRFHLDSKTAEEIVKVPNRTTFKSINEYKGKISLESYKKLNNIYQNVVINNTNIQHGSINNQGIIAEGDITIQVYPEAKTSTLKKHKEAESSENINRDIAVLPLTDTFSGIKTTVQKCVCRNNRLICYLLFEYVGDNNILPIMLKKGDTEITVDRGATFKNSSWTIGNQSTHPWYVNYNLLSRVPVEASVEFQVGLNVTKIFYLPIVGQNGFRNIPVSSQ